MRPLTRIFILTVLSLVMIKLFGMAHTSQIADAQDGSRLITFYAAIVGVGTIMAGVLCFWILPVIGDFMGGFLYAPAEKVDRHPHAGALAKVAAGEYEEAIEEFQQILQENPTDMLAAREIVHLYCDKVNNQHGAIEFLEESVQYGGWNDYQRGLLIDLLKELRVEEEKAHAAGENQVAEEPHKAQGEAEEFPDI